jgi:hypothetical protein
LTLRALQEVGIVELNFKDDRIEGIKVMAKASISASSSMSAKGLTTSSESKE